MSAFLDSLEKFGMNLGLERIKRLMRRLDDPHLKFKSIHIAGTNGKGSTAAMIASILQKAGYKVGLYTSPHFFDYTERIRINGRCISKPELNKGLHLVDKLTNKQTDQPTVFEALTAVAFWYFAKKKVDIAVVEVGLGGRLDATNVITPLVSVITNTALEHTEVLGKTVEKIAFEKAGIIKPGVPVVTAENNRGPLRVIKDICERNKCLLVEVEPDQPDLNIKLIGKHQRVNAACAIAAVRLSGLKVTKRAIEEGLAKVQWPGRFQVISKRPLIIVDGAHNPAGSRTLRVTIQEMFPGKFTLIFGCQEGKDFNAMMKELQPIISRLIVTRSSHPSAADPLYLANHFRRLKAPIEITYSVKEAVRKWGRKGPLLISGSLFVVGETLKGLKKIK